MTLQETSPALADLKDNPASPAKVTKARQVTLRLAYTAKELSAMLGISTRSLKRLELRGLLRSSNALRTRLFPHAEVERFLADTTNG